MYKDSALSPGRLVIHDLLRRSRRHHSPSTATFEWDITDTLARLAELKRQGVRVGRAALFTKATALTVRSHMRLNARMFFPLRGPREVAFEDVSCNLVVHRRDGGRSRLFPVVLRRVDEMPILEIAERINHYKTAPADTLDELKMIDRLAKIPRVLTRLHDRKVLTDPKYFIRRFGSYGLSTLVHENSGMTGGVTAAPNTTFYPTAIQQKPVVHAGKVVPRTMLLFGITIDHQIADGAELIDAALHLKELIENPAHLLGDL